MSLTILRGAVCFYQKFGAELVQGYIENLTKEVARQLLTLLKIKSWMIKKKKVFFFYALKNIYTSQHIRNPK